MFAAVVGESIEDSWKIVLEGARMEVRDGRIGTARLLYQVLLKCDGIY